MEKYTLTVNEAAEYTGIGRNSLRVLIAEKRLPTVRLGKKILIRRDTLEAFIKENEGKDILESHI